MNQEQKEKLAEDIQNVQVGLNRAIQGKPFGTINEAGIVSASWINIQRFIMDKLDEDGKLSQANSEEMDKTRPGIDRSTSSN